MLYTQVDPTTFINTRKAQPANGRGAWTGSGMPYRDYRYRINKTDEKRLGTQAEASLDAWAVSAGTNAIHERLVDLNIMLPTGPGEKGVYGPRTEEAVRTFQSKNRDPDGNQPLTTDGTVGRSDARALFTPLVRAAQVLYDIPDNLLVGEVNHESRLDPGAIGYYIYYGTDSDYRGVDRAMFQINSEANNQVTWTQAFDPAFAADWSGKRMRDYYNRYSTQYPKQSRDVLWDAAVLAHNNPSAAQKLAKNGYYSTPTAASYVTSVKNARY